MKRRKEQLIPFEKSKRIIRLERRGKEKSHSLSAIIFAVLGILCLLYCFSIAFFMGYGSKFFLIWGVMALLFGGLSYLFSHGSVIDKLPVWIKVGCLVCGAVGLICFVTVEGMIFSCFGDKGAPGADYLIVLGAQWKPSGPSYVLQKRLDAAVAYLQENPETLVIVSGGQGSNEPISEAEGMKYYLTQAGIAEDRIIMEDKSTSTYENLIFSADFLDKENDKVVLVTNNFHVFRAVKIAEKQGYCGIEGLSAPSYPALVPNNLLREFFCVVKDFVVGNM
uniref:YdcF family protein n=1 Tax=Acetatifactor sp. TaxID=1872090 RepID=UPI00405742FD